MRYGSLRCIKLSLVLILVTLLSGCVTLVGELKVSPMGKVTGQLTYTIDKSLAQIAGVATLEELNSKLREPEEVEFQDTCPSPVTSEDGEKYTIKCVLSGDEFTSDKDFGIFQENGNLVLIFRQNLEETNENSIDLDLGTVSLDVEFSSPVTKVSENRPGLLQRFSPTKFRLTGKANEKIDVRLEAKAGVGSDPIQIDSSSPIPTEVVEKAKKFQIAEKKFGGVISQDTRFIKANSPYRINSTIQIPEGKSVYVESGVVFDSIELSKLPEELSATFHVRGKIYFDGKLGQRIQLLGNPKTHFQTKFADERAGIYANFLHVIGGQNFIGDRKVESRINFKIYNSRIVEVKNTWEIVYPYGQNALFNNYFQNSSQIRALIHSATGSLTIQRNKFVGRAFGQNEKGKECWIESVAYYEDKLRVVENDFEKAEGFALCVLYENGIIEASRNFWGTSDESKISAKVLDAKDGLNYPSVIDVSAPLKTSGFNLLPTTYDPIQQAANASRAAELAKAEAIDATEEAAEFTRIANFKAEKFPLSSANSGSPNKGIKGSSTVRSISCVKGKQKLTVTGKKPQCPNGFRQK